ncbi:MAG: hypothetical protein ACI352_03570 [Elusimicrobiaceae bacterium]|nr:hypothetical protein [Elusimicrobiota bacterium]
MLTFIFRVFIVFTVFIAGAFVGNIYMPQKTLEQSYIVALDKPQTSLNEQEAPGFQNALNALKQMTQALEQTEMDKETLFNLEDSVQKQLYSEAFKAAKADYEIQLLKVQKHPENHDDFLKAKTLYYSLSEALSAAYPPRPKQEIIILDSSGAAQPNIQISASTEATTKENTQTRPDKNTAGTDKK